MNKELDADALEKAEKAYKDTQGKYGYNPDLCLQTAIQTYLANTPANEKSFVSKAEMQAQQEVEPSDNTPQVSVSDIMEVLMDARIISSPYADTARAIKQLYEGKK